MRGEIDRIDMQLLDLLNRRATCAVGIGDIKKKYSLPIFVPGREKEILERMTAQNNGPLSEEAVEDLFRVVFLKMKKMEGLAD